MDIQTEEVHVLGSWAYIHGTYQVNLTSRVSGKTKKVSGKFLDILSKQVDGSWKIAIDCHNFTMTPEEMLEQLKII
jgi:ketosteroid isomerase-like protein